MTIGNANKVVLTFAGQSKDLEQKFDRVGRSSDGFSKKLKGLGVAALAAGAAMGAAAVAFGVTAVKEFAEADTAQRKLQDAFERFPKLADTNIKALRKLNTERAKLTRFDDDATASAQAILAQYKLTGRQLEQLTPLVQDYAAKTGKDLPEAATLLGKALLGKGRSLADIGIKFKDTGTLAGNFDLIMRELSKQVGGFAEKEGTTAAGKLEILKNKFGELKEQIGGFLLPIVDQASTRLGQLFDKAGPAIDSFMNNEFKSVKDEFINFKNDLGPDVKESIDNISDAVTKNKDEWKKLGDTIGTTFKALAPLAGWIGKTLIPGIINDFAQAIAWVDAFRRGLLKILELLHIVKGTEKRVHLYGSSVNPMDRPPKFHGGGTMPGAPGTEGLALLQAGERVTQPGASAGAATRVVLGSDGSRLGDALIFVIREAVRARGGDPAVLGIRA